MKKEDVDSMMGKEGEGAKGAKALEQVGGKLQITLVTLGRPWMQGRDYCLYKYNQVGTDIKKVPELCDYFDVGKMKVYEILHGEKYGKEEEDSKKPLEHITPEPVPM